MIKCSLPQPQPHPHPHHTLYQQSQAKTNLHKELCHSRWKLKYLKDTKIYCEAASTPLQFSLFNLYTCKNIKILVLKLMLLLNSMTIFTMVLQKKFPLVIIGLFRFYIIFRFYQKFSDVFRRIKREYRWEMDQHMIVH